MIYNLSGETINTAYATDGNNLEQAYDIEGNPLLEPPTPVGRTIQMTKSGDTYQFRWPFDGNTMGWSVVNNKSENGGMDGGSFVVGTEPSTPTDIMTGWFYKSFLDDICPLHYNGSYRGAGHGEDTTWDVAMTGITPAASDIGTVWTDANNKDFVVFSITETAFRMISDFTGNDKAPVYKSAPSAPLVCGQRTASTISTTKKMMHPDINNRIFSVILSDNTVVTADGVYTSPYIDVFEKYNILNLKNMIAVLKANAGNNTPSSYYADTITADFEYTQRYRVQPDGVCTIYFNLVPKREGLFLDYFGGTQSTPMGEVVNIPFTDDYNALYSMASGEIINCTPETWEEANFPPFKLSQYRTDYNGRYGFEIAYCLDFGNAVPSVRKDINNAIYIFSSKKMYPYVYSADPAVDVYGETISGYVSRVPVCKRNGYTVMQYEAGGNHYAEIDFYDSFSGIVPIQDFADGTTVSTVKVNSKISSIGNSVTNGGIAVSSVAYGSATLRLGTDTRQ